MARVGIIGAGVCGLLAGTFLARDGHEVSIFERDPGEPGATAEQSWQGWERKGVTQFRQLHYLQARFRQEIERELPELIDEMVALGAVRYGLSRTIDRFTGGPRPGDEAFDSVTGRRPMIETAVARVAERTDGLTVRRGVAVVGLATSGVRGVVPHVTGVVLDSGETAEFDLVLDASGRRSGIDRLLDEAGARPPTLEQDDLGLVYFGRHFRRDDGSVPDLEGPILANCGTISTLTLPADNGTVGIGILAAGSDKQMRALKNVDTWERVLGATEVADHWLAGTPLADDVAVMANLPDRIRNLVVDGEPVATGVAVVADSWSCTNPSVGRGITIGLLHVLCLRRTLAATGLADPTEFALAFDAATVAEVEPWYRATVELDRARLNEMEALRETGEYTSDDPQYPFRVAFFNGAWHDPDLLRAFASVGGMLATPEEALAQPGIFDKVLTHGESTMPFVYPSRDELLELVAQGG
jgi:2-polyprenyl-6-methoxyphenol hydroxylase-like FAD-dependent oxidoreductase